MTKLMLILKDISDVYIRDNFFRLQKFLEDQPVLNGGFTFFQVDIKQPSSNFAVAHGLKFVPTDIIFLAVDGNFNFYFKYQNFDKDNIYISAEGPCVLRFMAGKMIANTGDRIGS